MRKERLQRKYQGLRLGLVHKMMSTLNLVMGICSKCELSQYKPHLASSASTSLGISLLIGVGTTLV
ncbi:hypothetical protein KSP39_PZI008730 [Platanthera zijinensis]|uniref:Uncharacterized protein n=1 Tax=Platanthera zijinensis TaxID=2320716 RepID=A0AAP0BLJ0_9ASPA